MNDWLYSVPDDQVDDAKRYIDNHNLQISLIKLYPHLVRYFGNVEFEIRYIFFEKCQCCGNIKDTIVVMVNAEYDVNLLQEFYRDKNVCDIMINGISVDFA